MQWQKLYTTLNEGPKYLLSATCFSSTYQHRFNMSNIISRFTDRRSGPSVVGKQEHSGVYRRGRLFLITDICVTGTWCHLMLNNQFLRKNIHIKVHVGTKHLHQTRQTYCDSVGVKDWIFKGTRAQKYKYAIHNYCFCFLSACKPWLYHIGYARYSLFNIIYIIRKFFCTRRHGCGVRYDSLCLFGHKITLAWNWTGLVGRCKTSLKLVCSNNSFGGGGARICFRVFFRQVDGWPT